MNQEPSIAIANRADWCRLALGLATVFALFQWSAAQLGSDRGQAGLAVAGLVVGATLLIECLWSRRTLPSTIRALGLGRPRVSGLAIAAGAGALTLLVVPMFVAATGSPVTTTEGWLQSVPGLFAQAGVAEETLFRGYLFGSLRTGRTFWRAATLSMLPFVAVHLLLFVTLPFVVALLALGVAVVTSFPLAHLYELGGRTIWPPALLPFVIQATPKLLVGSGEAAPAFPLAWMVAAATLPLCVFLARRPRSTDQAVAAA